MKYFLLGTVGLVAVGIAAPASAADLPAKPITKAPPPVVAPIYDWSGFYIGGHGGGAWGDRRWDETGPIGLFGFSAPLHGNTNASGALAGGQVGYNFSIRTLGFWCAGRHRLDRCKGRWSV